MAAAAAGRNGSDRRRDEDAHVEDALAAEELELTADEVTRLEERYVPHAVSGHE